MIMGLPPVSARAGRLLLVGPGRDDQPVDLLAGTPVVIRVVAERVERQTPPGAVRVDDPHHRILAGYIAQRLHCPVVVHRRGEYLEPDRVQRLPVRPGIDDERVAGRKSATRAGVLERVYLPE